MRDPPARPFDPVSGDWLPVEPRPAAVAVAAALLPRPHQVPAKKTGGAMAWHVLLSLDLAVVGLLIAVSALSAYVDIGGQGGGSGEVTSGQLIAVALLNFALFGALPLGWVFGTRVGGWRGAAADLRLLAFGRSLLVGTGLGLGLVLALLAIAVAYTAATGDELAEPEEDSPLTELMESLTWPVIIVVALSAGVGEEILFRGVLQRWLTWPGQAAVFAVAHFYSGYWLQAVVAFAIGLLFGWMYRRGTSLWVLIVAHTVYDFTLLATAHVAGTSGGG